MTHINCIKWKYVTCSSKQVSYDVISNADTKEREFHKLIHFYHSEIMHLLIDMHRQV